MRSSPRAQAILGVDGDPARAVDAAAVLARLGSDVDDPRGLRRPVLPGDEAGWLRVHAMPTARGDAPSPFELVLSSAADGEHTALTVLVHHTNRRGLRLFVSGGHVGPTSRMRGQLAPACDVEAATAPGIPRSWVGHGIRLRLQPERGEPTGARPSTRIALLDRLASITGDWAFVATFDQIPQLDVREAQLGAVRLGAHAAANLSSTVQTSSTRSSTTVSAEWTRVQQWSSTILDQLAQGGAEGCWEIAMWAFGADAWAASEVVTAARRAVDGDEGRRYMAFDQLVGGSDGGAPLSILTTAEAARVLDPPRASSPGIAVRTPTPAGRRPDASATPLDLGRYWSTDLPASIGLTDLEGHAFVTGTTGSGKTSTLHRLLAESWNRHRVPFLVVDPVKDEYSAVASLFHGGIRVVTGSELSMDLFATTDGEDQRRRVMQVAQAFKGAFTMPSPTPYVVTQLFDRVAMQPGGPAGTQLHDVRDAVDGLVQHLGYAPEAESNIRASLLTRLSLLLAPTRAHRFAWPDSSMLDAMFASPTIVTLADLVDEEERSFLVLLLAIATWTRARARTARRPVEHLLVLEEAHRVLPEVEESSDPEHGSARVASSQLLTSMLAEVRGYGQQVIVVDQSPSRVAADVVRNSNLKIVHRTVAVDDQRTMAAAIGLADDETRVLGSLRRGQALVSTRSEPAPQSIAIGLATTADARATARSIDRRAASWPCCSGRLPEAHFRAWQAAEQVEPVMALFLMACRLADDVSGAEARDLVSSRLAQLEVGLGASAHCLVWAGLRRLLVAERAAGLLPSAIAVDAQLTRLFAIWRDDKPASRASAKAHGVPATGKSRICPACGIACHVQVPAWSALRDAPRTGLSSLATIGWRSELADVGRWARDEVARLRPLLGVDGAARVVRCQVHQAVRRHRLGQEIADDLMIKAGLGPKAGHA